jgi:Ca-activated chloride channel family protein
MNSKRPSTLLPFGLEAWLEETRIHLPLREVAVRADVAAGFASAEIDMLFEQNNAEALDCRFVFPLPSAAAVYRCEMHVHGRVVFARVEERSAAEVLYEKAKREGHRAALARQERENLFTLELGNLQCGDRILIRFGYIETVQRLKEQFSLRIPLNAGIRYCPGTPLLRPNRGDGVLDDTDQVPDASRISPPRIPADHADAAGIDISIRLRGGLGNACAVSSPSHMVMVRMEDCDLVASLAGDRHVPDRDFVLQWSGQKNTETSATAWLDEKRRGILELRIPESAEEPDAPSRDIYFLLDRSGSMQGANWRGACKALAAFPSKLPATARVWLSLFDTEVRDYAEAPFPAREIDFGPDGEYIHRIGANGGTCIQKALEHIASKIQTHSSSRSAMVVLITDGQVGNESATLDAAKACGCPVHVLGIAMGVSDSLGALADETGGRAVFLSPGEDLVGAVERFAPVLGKPLVEALQLSPGWETVDGKALRDVVPGDTVIVPVSASGDEGRMVLSGRAADGSAWGIEPVECREVAAGLVWARARIRHLDRRDDVEALALAKETNILSAKSAFVAWDESEKVVVAKRGIFQPSFEPAMLAEGAGVLMKIDSISCLSAPRTRLHSRVPDRSVIPWELEEKLVPFLESVRVWLDGLARIQEPVDEERRIVRELGELLQMDELCEPEDSTVLEDIERLLRELIGRLRMRRERLGFLARLFSEVEKLHSSTEKMLALLESSASSKTGLA